MLGKRLGPKLCFCCCGALALHWLAIQRIWLLAAMLEFHFLRLLCLSGGSTQNDKTFGWNLARSFCGATVVSLLFCDSLFEASLCVRRVSFWPTWLPQRVVFSIFKILSSYGILITFACKAANCVSRLRILSKSAILSIRYKTLVLIQGFSSVPFKT